MLQGDPQYAFVQVGSNDETEITLVPRRWPASEESTKPPEPGVGMRSDSDDDSCTQVAATAQKAESLLRGLLSVIGGGSVQRHDWTLGEGVACDASREDGKLLHRCQSLTCGSRNQARRHVDLVPDVFSSEDRFGCTRDVYAECWTVLKVGDRSIRSMKKEPTQRGKTRRAGDCWIECVGSTAKPQGK